MGSRIVPAVATAPIVITNTGTQMTFTFDGRNMQSGTSEPKHNLEWAGVVDTARDEVRLQASERQYATSASQLNLRSPRLQYAYNITAADVLGKTYNTDFNRPELGFENYLDAHYQTALEESSFTAVGVASTFTYPAFASGITPEASQITVKRVRGGVSTILINGSDGSKRAADFTVNTSTRVVTLAAAGNTQIGDSYTVYRGITQMNWGVVYRNEHGVRPAAFSAIFEKTKLNTQGQAGVLEQMQIYGGLNGIVNFKESDQSGYPGATQGSVTTQVVWFNGVSWPTRDNLVLSRDGLFQAADNPIGYATTPGGVTQFAIGFPLLGGAGSTNAEDLSVYIGGSLSGGIPTGGTKQSPFGGAYSLAASAAAPGYGVLTFASAPGAGLVYWKARNNVTARFTANEDGAATLGLGANGGTDSFKLQVFGSWDQRTATPAPNSVIGYISVGQNNDPGLSGDANPTAMAIRRVIGSGSPRSTATSLTLGGTVIESSLFILDAYAARNALGTDDTMTMTFTSGGGDDIVILHSDYSTKRMQIRCNNADGTGTMFGFFNPSGTAKWSINGFGCMFPNNNGPGTASATCSFAAASNKPGPTNVTTPAIWFPFVNTTGTVFWVPGYAN